MRKQGAATVVVLALVLAGAGSVPASGQYGVPTESAGAADCAVAGQILAEFQRLPVQTTLEDYEGAALFAVSQVDCVPEALVATLEGLLDSGSFTIVQRQAVGNIAVALRRKDFRPGTGQISSAFGTSEFAAPLSGGAGGFSNYSAQ